MLLTILTNTYEVNNLSTENVSSLQTALKTAAQTVTGERVTGSEGFNIDRAYASSRAASSVALPLPVFINQV